MPFLETLQFVFELFASLRGVGDVAAFEQVEGSQGRATADGIAAERASMAARRPIHDLLTRDDRSQRHSAGDSLGQADNIRLHVPMLDCIELAGSAHAGLHLVGDEEESVFVAQCAESRQESRRGHTVAALALNWLNEDGGNFIRRRDAPKYGFLDLPNAFALGVAIVAAVAATGIGDMVNIR